MRIGFGTDTHAFAALDDDTFVQNLGCLGFKMPVKILANSDGDVVVHSIIDALLSGARSINAEMNQLPPTIGGFFDEEDYCAEAMLSGITEMNINPELTGEPMLKKVLKAISDKAIKSKTDYKIENVTISIVSNFPKIMPRLHEMEKKLSSIIGAPVTVSATTTDGIGEIGRGQGINTTAVVLFN
ncbi:MAG: 2-C-methyl-D-erythritol 2,4-cyclodiphosphate synthase [Bifidobacteriaceae bacterium]|jgi:2-C-methyl-D-erythritol 2,4-cyclodiphosphate synthase|nr:2-C-methyl-D-erythritol 2,4-cyclodiphosphate synthase [Bifidobacteriaceae bacterium]